MIIAHRYLTERADDSTTWRVRNLDAPLCPSCGYLCSGYDTRSRHSIDGAGTIRWFSLRRLRCPGCKKLHIEIPDFMISRKHYEIQVISDALAGGRGGYSPADDSTVRRWRRENRPPDSPVSVSNARL